MIYELVPSELHNDLNNFLHNLRRITLQRFEACPFCGKSDFYLIRTNPTNTYRCKACNKYSTAATNTPFNRLTPFNWLEIIFTYRIKNKSYQYIAKKLACSLEKVIRRDHAIIQYLKINYTCLYRWYTDNKQAKITTTLEEQHQVMNTKIMALLNEKTPTCLHCGSSETTKVGTRTCYRCKRCRQSFNILGDTQLNKLPRADLWLQFIDLLVSGENNLQIEKKMNFSSNTVRRWRSAWCDMMKNWDCNALAVWCSRH